MRLLCDEMLGSLARWLRLLGVDVAYVQGVHDDVLAQQARDEDRVLVTRDAALAARVPGSILLRPPSLDCPTAVGSILFLLYRTLAKVRNPREPRGEPPLTTSAPRRAIVSHYRRS